jgi:hypothetical protein
MEAKENLYHEPECYQYLCEETESSVNNIGRVSFRGRFVE